MDAVSTEELQLKDSVGLSSFETFPTLDTWLLTDIKWREYLKGAVAGCGFCIFAYYVRLLFRNWSSSHTGETDTTRPTYAMNGESARIRLNSSRSRRLRGSELGMADQRSSSFPANALRFSENVFVSEQRNDPTVIANGNGVTLDAVNTLHELMPSLGYTGGDTVTDNEIRKQEGQHLMTLLFHIGEDQAKRESVRHNGFSCNVCEANPLTGVRYKCANCNDFDVCERCEVSCEHDPTHVFIKIKIPIPPLAFPRSTLLPKFYPGKPGLHQPISWQQVLELKEQTYFETSDIESLYDKYSSLCNDTRGISKEVYYRCLGPLGTPKNLALDQIFKFFDRSGDGFINFEEFTVGISTIARGTHEEKLRHVFEGYDVDGDGFISKNELYRMLDAYYHINVELLKDVIKSCEESLMTNYENLADKPISSIFKAPIPVDTSVAVTDNESEKRGNSNDSASSSTLEEDKSNRWRDLSPTSKESFHSFPVVEAMVRDAIQEMVSGIMQEADLDRDGKLSFEEFAQYAVVDVSLLSWFEEFAGVF